MNLNMLLSIENTLLHYAHVHIHCVRLAPSVIDLNFMHKVKYYRKTSIMFIISEHGSK